MKISSLYLLMASFLGMATPMAFGSESSPAKNGADYRVMSHAEKLIRQEKVEPLVALCNNQAHRNAIVALVKKSGKDKLIVEFLKKIDNNDQHMQQDSKADHDQEFSLPQPSAPLNSQVSSSSSASDELRAEPSPSLLNNEEAAAYYRIYDQAKARNPREQRGHSAPRPAIQDNIYEDNSGATQQEIADLLEIEQALKENNIAALRALVQRWPQRQDLKDALANALQVEVKRDHSARPDPLHGMQLMPAADEYQKILEIAALKRAGDVQKLLEMQNDDTYRDYPDLQRAIQDALRQILPAAALADAQEQYRNSLNGAAQASPNQQSNHPARDAARARLNAVLADADNPQRYANSARDNERRKRSRNIFTVFTVAAVALIAVILVVKSKAPAR